MNRSLKLLAAGLVGAVLAGSAGPEAAPMPSVPVAADPAAALHERLRVMPQDAQAWSDLGSLYVEQARLGTDPAAFRKAREAFSRSTALLPRGNAEALAGRAALADAEHDFRSAIVLARRALRLNPGHSRAYGALADAYLNLGRTGEAADAIEHMLLLRPGVASFTRAANLFEFRGERQRAGEALDRARQIAVSPTDQAFCDQRRGELAWNSGDAAASLAANRRALAADPGYAPALAGAARAEAALGRVEAALALYGRAVGRSPQPQYLLEFGEFLESIGRREQARTQYEVLKAEARLGTPDGLVLGRYEADHGDPAKAVALLAVEWRRRPNTIVADAYGWALHRAGRDREALRYARRALATPESARHRRAIEKAVR